MPDPKLVTTDLYFQSDEKYSSLLWAPGLTCSTQPPPHVPLSYRTAQTVSGTSSQESGRTESSICTHLWIKITVIRAHIKPEMLHWKIQYLYKKPLLSQPLKHWLYPWISTDFLRDFPLLFLFCHLEFSVLKIFVLGEYAVLLTVLRCFC